MGKIKLFSKKAGFIVAVAGATVVGGATTALVTAAIPSSTDGQIHACYRNSTNLTNPKGALRVIDSEASQACTTQETGIGLSDLKVAYVNFKFDPITSEVSVANTRNVTSIQPAGNGNYCVKVSFDPKTVSATNEGSGPIELRGISTEEDSDINSWCDSSYNALIPSGGQFMKVTFTD
jgi:hypothetical protein